MFSQVRCRYALLITVIITTAYFRAAALQMAIAPITDQQRLQAVQLAYPAAQLDSSRRTVIPQSDGSVKTVVTNGLSRRQVPTGFLYITGVDIQEDEDNVATQLNTFTPVANGSANSKIVVFYTDNTGKVTSSNVAVLDSNAASTGIVDFYWETVPTDGSFPVIRILYYGLYEGSTWIGSVRWAAKVQTADMSLQERVPVAFIKQNKDGTQETDYLTPARVDANTIQISSGISGNTLTYLCGSVCVVDGVSLLNNL